MLDHGQNKANLEGKGNEKSEAKSFRPVALLPACGRIIEGLLAKQMDSYSQERNILRLTQEFSKTNASDW